jgi:cytoskeletal protein RodZ
MLIDQNNSGSLPQKFQGRSSKRSRENLPMESPGKYLKKEREKRGVSLEEISQATRITPAFLRDIEEDRYGFLPAPVITRGYLRSYAKELGLDDKEVISRYQDYLETSEEGGKNEKEELVKAKKPYGKYLLLFLLLTVLAFLVAYFNLDLIKREEISPCLRRERDRQAEKVVKPATQVPPEKIEDLFENKILKQSEPEKKAIENSGIKVEEKEEIFRQPKEDMAPLENSGINLVAKISELTWIRFWIDEGQVREVLLRPGEIFSWKAQKKLNLLIGNAGGADFTLDRKHLGYLGPSGKVVSLTLPR